MNMNMKPIEIQKMAYALFEQYDLKDWTFQFDNAKVRFGLCDLKTKTISMSKKLVSLNEEKDIVDTLLHEMAHAVTSCGHNRKWRHTAILMGCNGKRCYSSNEIVKPKPKFIGTCPQCETKINRYNKTKSMNNISCKKCCKQYNPEFQFVWKKI